MGWSRQRSCPFSTRKFDQNRIVGNDQDIRDQVGQQNTRDQEGETKQAIREQAIGWGKGLGSESSGSSDQGARDWWASDWWVRKSGREWLGSNWNKKCSKKWMIIIFLWHFISMSWNYLDLRRKHTWRMQDGRRACFSTLIDIWWNQTSTRNTTFHSLPCALVSKVRNTSHSKSIAPLISISIN